jgi:hypothetical protein
MYFSHVRELVAAISDTEVYQRTLNHMQGSEVGIACCASFGEPFAKLTSLFDRRNSAGAGQCQGDQCIWCAVSNKRRLQGGLFAKVQRKQEFNFHERYSDRECIEPSLESHRQLRRSILSDFVERPGDVSDYILRAFNTDRKTHGHRLTV